MNLTEVTDLTSIGTLFAFVLVCGGVLILDRNKNIRRGFRVPYINAKFIAPALFVIFWILLLAYNREAVSNYFSVTDPTDATVSGWEVVKHKIPQWLFLVFAMGMIVLSFVRSLSLIPVLGVLTCGYLMSELGFTNWWRFLLWLVIGLVVYFFYGHRHSRLAKAANQ
jgi:preprotein translocase subunit SecG